MSAIKASLLPGSLGTRLVTVDEQRCISFMGRESMVYSTPRLMSDMEGTCRDLLLAHLAPGHDSVGTHAALDHTAATPLGMQVTVEAQVVAVEGRSVTFDVIARDTLEECGRARHVRFVVENEKRRLRLADKRSKAARINKET